MKRREIKHAFIVIPGDEDEGGYTVIFPSLPGCMTFGDDLLEAIYMATDAYEGWTRTAEIRGTVIKPHEDPTWTHPRDEKITGESSYTFKLSV